MALDRQQKRMAVAGRVFPSNLDEAQRVAVAGGYPVASFGEVASGILFIIHYLDTLSGLPQGVAK